MPYQEGEGNRVVWRCSHCGGRLDGIDLPEDSACRGEVGGVYPTWDDDVQGYVTVTWTADVCEDPWSAHERAAITAWQAARQSDTAAAD